MLKSYIILKRCFVFAEILVFSIENWRPGNRGVLRTYVGNLQKLRVGLHPVLPVQRLRLFSTAAPSWNPAERAGLRFRVLLRPTLSRLDQIALTPDPPPPTPDPSIPHPAAVRMWCSYSVVCTSWECLIALAEMCSMSSALWSWQSWHAATFL